MAIPVKVFGDYVVCFEDEIEEIPARSHFIKQCGWTESQFRGIKGYAWFSAKVSIWKDGSELTSEYLGCCCYKEASEFYTTYVGDYFLDMVRDCARAIADPELTEQVAAWRP